MESQIPDKVTQSQYCRQLATTNKYECDFRFYEQLQQELKQLELWDEFTVVANLKEQVVHIKEMTIKHAKSLDEDETPDEKQVRKIAESIREALLSLDTSCIPKIIQKMNSTNAKSITRLVLEEVSKEESGKYNEMVIKLFKTVHNPQIRTQSILTLGLFYLLNNQNAEKIINTYRGLIDRSIDELKKFKPLLAQISCEKDENSQILSAQKFRDFVEGTKIVYQTTVRLYDVFRILSGQTTYKFKLGNLRVEINQGVSQLDQGLHSKFQPIVQESLQTHKRQLGDYVSYLRQKTPESILEIKSQVCSFCLLPDNVVISGNKTVHPTCWNVIRTLSKK